MRHTSRKGRRLSGSMASFARHYRLFWYGAALLLYLVLATYQLGLPGLHYDEAREAGVNAMELLTGAPVQAFRGAGVELAGRTWPLMVQDYIGALNVYLALPFLAATGIGVPNLRLLAVLTGLAALLLLERTLSEWVAWRAEDTAPSAPLPAQPPPARGNFPHLFPSPGCWR